MGEDREGGEKVVMLLNKFLNIEPSFAAFKDLIRETMGLLDGTDIMPGFKLMVALQQHVMPGFQTHH